MIQLSWHQRASRNAAPQAWEHWKEMLVYQFWYDPAGDQTRDLPHQRRTLIREAMFLTDHIIKIISTLLVVNGHPRNIWEKCGLKSVNKIFLNIGLVT